MNNTLTNIVYIIGEKMKKKIALVLVLLLVGALVLGGCATQHSVKFYIGENLYKEYRCDSNGKISGLNPTVNGYRLIGWFETEDEATPFDFSKPISASVTLHAKFVDAFTNKETFTPVALENIDVDDKFATFEAFGKVLSVAKGEQGYFITAEGYYGYHMDLDPSMTMAVAIGLDGNIKSVSLVKSKDQSEGYAEMITNAYLNSVYNNIASSTTLDVDPSTGATRTSIGVVYAVRTASYYAEKALGIVADTGSKDNAEFNEIYNAEYTKITSNYVVDKNIGQILYVASGIDQNGKQVIGIKVKSSSKVNFDGTVDYGWDSTIPGQATMIIIIEKDTNKVVAYKVVNSGASKPEYFDLPKAKLDAYLGTVVSSANVYDDFKGGLVINMDVPTTPDPSSGMVITGTSIIYTGATVNGTYTSQFVRLCYKAAADFYVNYSK